MLARCWGSVPFEEVIQNALVMVCGDSLNYRANGKAGEPPCALPSTVFAFLAERSRRI